MFNRNKFINNITKYFKVYNSIYPALDYLILTYFHEGRSSLALFKVRKLRSREVADLSKVTQVIGRKD